MEKCEHDFIIWRIVCWYRKCKKCGEMGMTANEEGFTYQAGFDD